MKKIYFFMLACILMFQGVGQNAIVGSGFSSGWGGGSCPTGNGNFNYLSSSVGTSYLVNTTANGTGDQYFRFGIDWSGTFAQRTITPGSNTNVTPNNTYALNSNCTTGGAMFYNVPNTSYRYIFKTLNTGTNPTGTFVFFEVQGAVRTILSVSNSCISAGQNVTITANLNGALSTGQDVYIRYSIDNFSTSTVVKLTGSGTTYNSDIPASTNTAGANVVYYLFTSGTANVATDGSNADLYSINLNNNGGSNYTYSPKSVGTWLGGSTDWNTACNWSGGVPTSSTNVVIPSGGTQPTISTTSPAALANNITINSGATLTISGGGALEVYGAITNSGSLNASAGEIRFKGAAAQTIPSLTVNNLTIDNTSGVILGGAVTVNGILTFSNGILTTTAANLLTLNTSATVSGTIDNTRFVNGPLAKVGTTAFTFPVGKTGSTNRLGRCGIGAPSTSSTFTAEYFVAAPPTVPATFAAPTGLGSLSTSEYWDIARSAGSGAASVTLFFDDGTFSGVTSGTIFSGLTVGHRDGMTASDWKSETSSPTGSPAAGSITTGSALTSFSPFTIGTITAITLPLAVNSFVASKQNNNTNAINWKATCTGASCTFELQRSINGIIFLPINSLTATQARCAAPFNYTDNYYATSPITYYKLKVISNTGEIKYSQIIAINNKNTVSNTLAIYPNVVKDKAVLVIESKTSTNVNFVITDAKGAIIKKFTENLSEGANAYPLNLNTLSAGSYQISGIVDGALKTIRFIKSL